MKRVVFLSLVVFSLLFIACSSQQQHASRDHQSWEAKHLLQGIWNDGETEDVIFKMQGDSVFFPDSTSMPAYFFVVDDTLYIGSSLHYHIEKHTAHLLWFKDIDGKIMKLQKSEDHEDRLVFVENKPKVQTLTEVLKRDTVVTYKGQRYHLYIAINPTHYKVVHPTLNKDGIPVDNIYYDNIIHLSIFQGAEELYSSDIRKNMFSRKLAAQILGQCVLNDMVFRNIDDQGFHLDASLCIPGNVSCYLIENIISFTGNRSSKLVEY